MNSYELSRAWFNWCFENPEKINANHTALYFFAIEHCNRLGWKEKFGLPTQITMEAVGIKNWRTYSNTLNDLIEFGFIKLVEKSKNQYSSNIISLIQTGKTKEQSLDNALKIKSNKDKIDFNIMIKSKEFNNYLKVNKLKITEIDEKIIYPTLEEVKAYFKENYYSEQSAISFFNYYNVSNWCDSKGVKVLNWQQKAQSLWFKPENKIKKTVLVR